MFSSYAPFGDGDPVRRGTFRSQYRCYSVSMFTDRQELEEGGKVIMPPSALDTLTQLNTQYPMLFKLTNPATQMTSHCGVLEFIADEGKMYLPYWMMTNLGLPEGGILNVESSTLPLGNYAQFQPQSRDFLQIYNPKAVLEASLRKLSCLSLNDMLEITYNEKKYQFRVMTLKPADAVSIIECDLSVDFAPYIGAEEDEKMQQAQRVDAVEAAQELLRANEEKRIAKALQEAEENSGKFKAFAGSGHVLDTGTKSKKRGKKSKAAASSAAASSQASSAPSSFTNGQQSAMITSDAPRPRGIPNHHYQKGTLTFARVFPNLKKQEEPEEDSFESFGGEGHSMRKKKR